MIKLPGYTVTTLIHDGPRSRVYRGSRLTDGRPVIVKVHRREPPSFLELGHYRNHYTITRDLSIQGVDRPLALESFRNGFALVSDDTGAVDLKSHAGGAPLDPVLVLEIAAQLARVLEGLHARSIIHKDIKPDNIVIDPETKAVTLIDFSIASLLPREGRELQRPSLLEGTLAYISPEQTGRMNRGVDYRSDYYSLGVTLYELLTGRLPFQSTDPMELIHGHIARRPAPPDELTPGIPPALSGIVMKLLEKRAEARYQSAAGLRHDLEACLEQVRAGSPEELFPLGRMDQPDRFLLPERLYGREAEAAQLLGAFDRVSEGATELVLVAGGSGVGKSALVNEVQRPIVRRRGYFVSGKFDQLRRDIPLSSLVQAFQGLIRQVLLEPRERVGAFRAKLAAALGHEGQAIAEVMPEIEHLIGPQPPLLPLPPADARERFHRVLQRFIRVFAGEPHPLVLFLDDLQWADAASLELIQLLLGEGETPYLLVVGAYRDNEVGPTHPLAIALDRMRRCGAALSQITLRPLELPDLDLLLADALRRSPGEVRDLSEHVLGRTQGNPFFGHQYLSALHRQGLIAFDAARGHFRYELPAPREGAERSDVVELMTERILKLPARTQEALTVCAALGSPFDLATLAIARERSQAEAAADLWPALEAGLLLPLDEAYRAYQQHETGSAAPEPPAETSIGYRFLHDRVQQAAYARIPGPERAATHLAIGRLLLRSLPAAERRERIFDLVNHLDTGSTLIEDPGERRELAELNLLAGMKAKASTAYASAARYLAIGMELLGPDPWSERYELSAALHRERAEVEYLEGHFDVSEALVRALIEHARTPVEKAEASSTMIVQYTLRARYPEAIQAGREALSLIGIHLPVDGLAAARDEAMAEVERLIGGREIASLHDLPDMDRPEHKVAMRLLTTMGPPTYRSHQALWSVICAKAVELSLRHGNAPQVAYSHTAYGGLLGSVRNDHRAGAQFGELALRLSKRFDNPHDQSVAYLMVGSSLRHWSQHLRRASEDYHKAYSIGLESGNLQYAAYAFGHDMYCRFYQGVNLEQLLAEIDGYLAFSRRRKNQWAIDLLQGGRLVVLNLLGMTGGPTDFSGGGLAEAQFLDDCAAHRNAQVVCIYNVLKTRALILQGQLAEARACFREADAAIASVATQGLLPSAQHRFDEALLLAAAAEGAPEEERARASLRLDAIHRQFEVWAESCPENFLHQRLLVDAEAARLAGRHADAVDLYDRAIEAAKSSQLQHDAALAEELAARCWLARGKERIAQHYLTEAYYGYVRWGAAAKVAELERRHPELLATATAQAARPVTVGETISSAGASDALDLDAMLALSQAIFREIVLERLLETLLRVVMQSAGAERGFVLLPRGGSFSIEAASASTGEIQRAAGAPLDGSQELCEALVRHVARTGEAVVLEDMSATPAYAADPYVVARRPRSLLCVPALNLGKLCAIVYLENNLMEGCFTTDRLEITRVLVTQAAIAVDNALMVAELQRATAEARGASERLETEVKTRTEELRAANEELRERTEELRVVNERLRKELVDREGAERARAALQEEIIAAQRERLAELSTPLIPITREIMVMPLIGTVDTRRAEQVLASALEGAQASRARVLILDVTGMRQLDSGVAAMLVKTASALRLLGAEAVLTGLRPELAQTLVALGVELASVVTLGTLERGIAYAMRRIGAPFRP